MAIQPTAAQHGWQQQLSDPYHGTGGNGANHGVKHGAQKIDPMLLLDASFGTNSHHNSGQQFRGVTNQPSPPLPSMGNPINMMMQMMMMMLMMMMKMLGLGQPQQSQEQQAANFCLKNFDKLDKTGDGNLEMSELQKHADCGCKHSKTLISEMKDAGRTWVNKTDLKDMAAGKDLVPEIKDAWIAKHGQYKRNGDGTVDLTGGKHKGCKLVPAGKDPSGRTTWDVQDKSGERVGVWTQKHKTNVANKVASPLQIDVKGDGIQTKGKDAGHTFDINGNGTTDKTGWAAKDDIVLAMDVNNDGKINSGKELFGNNTVTKGGQGSTVEGSEKQFANGYEALKATVLEHPDGKRMLADNKLTIGEMEELGLSAVNSKGEMIKTEDLRATLGDDFELSIKYEDKHAKGTHETQNGNELRQVNENSADVWYAYEDGKG